MEPVFFSFAAVATVTVVAPSGHGYLGATSNGKMAQGMAIDETLFYASLLDASRISAHYGAIGVSPKLVRLGELTITDATGTRIFGGYVSGLDDASTTTEVHTVLDCIDYFQALDRTEVNEVFIGDTDIDIIRYICTNYAQDIDLTDIPLTGTYSFDKRYIRAKSVMEALQGVAKVTGYAIWVTPDKKLQYKSPSDVSTAPFSLSDEPDFVARFGYDLNNHKLDCERYSNSGSCPNAVVLRVGSSDTTRVVSSRPIMPSQALGVFHCNSPASWRPHSPT